MAGSKHRTELEIALLDQVSGPSKHVLAAVRRLDKELSQSSIATSKAIENLRSGEKLGRNFTAGVERGLRPLRTTFGPNGVIGHEALRGFDEVGLQVQARASSHARAVDEMGRRISASSMTHAAAAARSYDLVTASAMAAARAVAPIAAGLGVVGGVKAAANFESSLTEIEKKSGATADEVAKVGEEIKALAVSGRVAAGIDEIAAAYARGAAAGIPLAELKEFAELSVKAADAFEMSAEEVGNYQSKLKTSLGMTNDEVKQSLDLTNTLADSGIANERDIVNYVDRAAATLKTLGLTNAQTLSLGTTFLNMGFATEVAATASGALAGKLLTVGTLTGKAKKGFEKVMGPTENFAKLVEKDANAALIQLMEKLKSLPKAQKAAFLKDFVGAEWADEMIRLSDGVDEYRRNLSLAADETKWFGSLDKSYALKLDDFWSQWKILRNAIEKLSINIATPGMPALVAGMKELVELSERVQRGFDEMRLRIDFSALDEAGAAVGRLKKEVGDALGVGAEGSELDRFFRDLARLVNETAAGVKAVADEFRAIAKFARDPIGELTRERTPEELRAAGITPFTDADRARLTAEKERTVERPAQAARETSLDAFADGRPLAPAEPTLPAQHAGRVAPAPVLPDAARFAPDPLPGETSFPEIEAGLNNLAAALRARADRADRVAPTAPAAQAAGPTIPIPTPRPDIVGPLKSEGLAANAEAVSIATKMLDALSITAAPRVDASSIVAALQATQRLSAALSSLPLGAATAPSVGAGVLRGMAPAPLPKKAGGGAVRRGPYLVGERGPEVVHMGGNGYVTPNHRLGGGGTITNHFNISGAGDPKAVAKEVMSQMNRATSRSQQIGMNR